MIKDNKSPGVDVIPPKLLKEFFEQISTPLAKLFNLSLEEVIVPSEWNEANITPLFKKGSRNKPENYRPVSLTSVVCKLLETLIRDHMVEFLVKHKLINTSQHGFLKARSCVTNFFEEITRRATKMIPELRDVSYESRLLQCGLTTLETRRLRGDQIEVFKIVNGYEDVDRNMFFKLKDGSKTRGHKVALVKEQGRLDMRKYSFSKRVIN